MCVDEAWHEHCLTEPEENMTGVFFHHGFLRAACEYPVVMDNYCSVRDKRLPRMD
jgi:hypothetical protein